MESTDNLDICMVCGTTHESELWGAQCCGGSCVHLIECSGCSNVMGQLTDDDYCGPDVLYCHECVTKAEGARR